MRRRRRNEQCAAAGASSQVICHSRLHKVYHRAKTKSLAWDWRPKQCTTGTGAHYVFFPLCVLLPPVLAPSGAHAASLPLAFHQSHAAPTSATFASTLKQRHYGIQLPTTRYFWNFACMTAATCHLHRHTTLCLLEASTAAVQSWHLNANWHTTAAAAGGSPFLSFPFLFGSSLPPCPLALCSKFVCSCLLSTDEFSLLAHTAMPCWWAHPPPARHQLKGPRTASACLKNQVYRAVERSHSKRKKEILAGMPIYIDHAWMHVCTNTSRSGDPAILFSHMGQKFLQTKAWYHLLLT